MPEEYKIFCKQHGIRYTEQEEFTPESIAGADILYMTRVQKERFSDLMEYERVKNVYILRNDMLHLAKPNMRILHPLPRVNEIAYDEIPTRTPTIYSKLRTDFSPVKLFLPTASA